VFRQASKGPGISIKNRHLEPLGRQAGSEFGSDSPTANDQNSIGCHLASMTLQWTRLLQLCPAGDL